MVRLEMRNEKFRCFGFRIWSAHKYRQCGRFGTLACAILCLLIYHGHILPHLGYLEHKATTTNLSGCPPFALSSDILVVMRTGATEALEKLPVHFETTLRCVQDFIILSDYKEIIHGHPVHDVFEGSTESLGNSPQELKLYNHLRIHGREGLERVSHLGSGPT